jgi:hypothetical protein
MGPEDLRRWYAVDEAGPSMLDLSFEKLGLSARALGRIFEGDPGDRRLGEEARPSPGAMGRRRFNAVAWIDG